MGILIKKCILGFLISMNVVATGTIVVNTLEKDELTDSEVEELCAEQKSDSIVHDDIYYSCVNEQVAVEDKQEVEEKEEDKDIEEVVKEDETTDDTLYVYFPTSQDSKYDYDLIINDDKDEVITNNPVSNDVVETDDTEVDDVIDVKPPTISLSTDNVTISEGEDFDPDDYIESVTDNVDGNLIKSVEIENNVNPNVSGTYTVKITVTDSANNTTTRTIIVVVEAEEDTNAPVITLTQETENIYVGDEFDPNDYLVSAIDDIDGDITQNVIMSSTVDTFKAGTYYVEYNISDSVGNKSSVVLIVTVEEVIDKTPSITLIDNEVTITEGEEFYPYEYLEKAEDYNGQDITDYVEVTGYSQGMDVGKYEIIYSVENSGIRVEEVLTLTIEKKKDTTAPIIQLYSGSVTLEFGQKFDIEGNLQFAKDDVDGDLTDKVEIEENVDYSTPGTYRVKYMVEDSSGNRAAYIMSITILEPEDTEAPNINLTSYVVELIQGSLFDKDMYLESAYDNIDGDLTSQVEVSGEIHINEIGEYALTYYVEDNAGNRTSVLLTVKVVNSTNNAGPVINLTHNEVDILLGSQFYPMMYVNSALDADSNNLYNDVKYFSNVDVNNEGSYEVVYSVEDESGNVTKETLYVTVSSQIDW